MTYALWTAQVLLALLFLFGGVVKLVMPIDELLAQMPLPLPGLFIQFVGVAEVLGALGLLLPSILRIRPGLTPLAATCLTILMVGAAGYGLLVGDMLSTVIPLVVGIVAAFVAYGRWRLAPIRRLPRRPALQPAS
jgi:hypothetical protein